ncbi:MAG: sialate O-acetylesterase [Niabella sp.]
MKQFFFLLFFVLKIIFNAEARIELPAILGSGMVLQQRSEVPIWGRARANFMVKVKPSWDTRTYTVKSDGEGNWRVLIKTPSAGGPYNISITDDEKITLSDVLTGEVWVCSGQSNMEMPMKGFSNQPTLHSNDIVTEAANNSLRLFQVQRAVSVRPEYSCEGRWQVSSPESALSFSAIGFQFGKRLQEILKVPVGIIQSTWGGTPIEAWMDKESILRFSERQIPVPGADAKADRLETTCLFNAMINPIVGYGIKGFLWYQGETNVPRASEYADLMTLMVTGWRRLWKQDSLSFYYVQIAPWNYGAKKEAAPYLREAQYNALSLISNSGMVVSMDKGSSTTIHPSDKTTISNRLLYWALGDTYHVKGIAYQSPYFEKIVFKKDTAVLTFKNTPNGFTSNDEEITGFQVAGADRVFHEARAKIVKNTIEVINSEVKNPVAVRYAFTDIIKTNLYSVEGLPVAPFRTDNW